MNPEIIANTQKFVKQELEGICSAHDYYHIERVWKLARKIYRWEKQGDILAIELGAILHESFDEKFYSAEQISEKKITLREFLENQELGRESLQKVFFILENIGFGKSLDRKDDFPMTPELAIVEDADRVEAIGAIGIARCFTYGGKHKRAMYDPSIPHLENITKSDYHNPSKVTTSLNHFYEKLLKLKDLLHTKTARSIASERQRFMERFVEQFLLEWNVEN